MKSSRRRAGGLLDSSRPRRCHGLRCDEQLAAQRCCSAARELAKPADHPRGPPRSTRSKAAGSLALPVELAAASPTHKTPKTAASQSVVLRCAGSAAWPRQALPASASRPTRCAAGSRPSASVGFFGKSEREPTNHLRGNAHPTKASRLSYSCVRSAEVSDSCARAPARKRQSLATTETTAASVRPGPTTHPRSKRSLSPGEHHPGASHESRRVLAAVRVGAAVGNDWQSRCATLLHSTQLLGRESARPANRDSARRSDLARLTLRS